MRSLVPSPSAPIAAPASAWFRAPPCRPLPRRPFPVSHSRPASSYSQPSSTFPSTQSSSSPSTRQNTFTWPSSTDPSPYAILHISPTIPKYTKSTSAFSHWVKLYHPDHSNCCCPASTTTSPSGGGGGNGATSSLSISAAEKARRLSLVLAADKLLSNPSKREAYDRYGFGWERCITTHPDAYTRAPTGTRGTPFRTTGPGNRHHHSYNYCYYHDGDDIGETSTHGDGPIPRAQAKALALFWACLTLAGIGIGVQTAFEREERMKAVHRRANRDLAQVRDAARDRWERAVETERSAQARLQGTMRGGRSDGLDDGIAVDERKVIARVMDEWRERLQDDPRTGAGR